MIRPGHRQGVPTRRRVRSEVAVRLSGRAFDVHRSTRGAVVQGELGHQAGPLEIQRLPAPSDPVQETCPNPQRLSDQNPRAALRVALQRLTGAALHFDGDLQVAVEQQAIVGAQGAVEHQLLLDAGRQGLRRHEVYEIRLETLRVIPIRLQHAGREGQRWVFGQTKARGLPGGWRGISLAGRQHHDPSHAEGQLEARAVPFEAHQTAGLQRVRPGELRDDIAQTREDPGAVDDVGGTLGGRSVEYREQWRAQVHLGRVAGEPDKENLKAPPSKTGLERLEVAPWISGNAGEGTVRENQQVRLLAGTRDGHQVIEHLLEGLVGRFLAHPPVVLHPREVRRPVLGGNLVDLALTSVQAHDVEPVLWAQGTDQDLGREQGLLEAVLHASGVVDDHADDPRVKAGRIQQGHDQQNRDPEHP